MVHTWFFYDKYVEEELTSQNIFKILMYTAKLISKMTLLLYSSVSLYLSDLFSPHTFTSVRCSFCWSGGSTRQNKSSF